MVERMIETAGVELCTEPFGDPGDPPILLVMGVGASMLWWEEGFCRMLAGGGRYVIRYDHRDTGRSVTYEPGRPGYTGSDLVADAAGILDAYGIPAAHIVGVSAGGAFAQLLALDFPERVLSLVLISTSPALPGDRALPPPTEEFARFVSTARVDWSDADSVIRYLVGYSRVLAGGLRPFDEAGIRDLVVLDVERARDAAARQNHYAIPEGGRRRASLSSIAVPALVIHGTADPMFPIGHGEALADEIPGAGRCGSRTRAMGSSGRTGRPSSARSSTTPRPGDRTRAGREGSPGPGRRAPASRRGTTPRRAGRCSTPP